MVKITNGVNTFEVTNGSFRNTFKNLGYRIIQVEDQISDEDRITSDEVAENKDEVFCKELEEKPVSQWNKSEIKKYAALKCIDISNTKNAGEAKEIIVKFLESEPEV